MAISRRYFLKNGGIAMLGMAAFRRSCSAPWRRRPPEQEKDGGALPAGRDGRAQCRRSVWRAELLPHASHHCHSAAFAQCNRRTSAIDLDGFFGLHPSLAPLVPLFRNGQLAIVQAVGSPDATRSHFDAQDFMESGTPGLKATEDGWLNRALQTMPENQATPFRAVAFGPYLPRTCRACAGASRFRI